MSTAAHVAAQLARVCLTERCPSCGGRTDAAFCAGCRADLAAIVQPCARCGLPQPVPRCPRRAGWLVERVIAPFEYAPPLDGYLQALKFGHGRMLGRALALLAAGPIAAHLAARAAPEVLVPVPLHRRRLVARGYNQATEIARTLSAAVRVPLDPAVAVRFEAATPQSRLGARERRANVAHAFAVRGDVCGRRVAIVDDVITTGATINALAAALVEAGALRVEAWAIARAVRQRLNT